jgi:hypothetical protein
VRNPDIVGEDYPVVCWIPFAEAMVDVVHCSWAVPDHLRISIKMPFLLWSGACGAGDSGGGITLWRWCRILLWWRGRILLGQGRILLGQGRILLGQGRILLQWGISCRGFSMCILVDGAGEHVLHPLQSVLEYGCCVLCFDYDSGWQWCTDGRGNGKDGDTP